MTTRNQSVLRDFSASEQNASRYWKAMSRQVQAIYSLDASSETNEIDLGSPVNKSRAVTAKRSVAFPWLIYNQKNLKEIQGKDSIEQFITAEESCFPQLELANKSLWNSLPFASNDDQKSTVQCTKAVSAHLQKALRLIETLWPEAYAEFQEIVRGIVWISSRRTYSLSDPKLFGILFFNADYFVNRSYAELATDIIHETAHHSLFVETSIDKLIPDDYKKPIFSPLRLEYRPAIGSLHAGFSLARMLEWGRILLNTKDSELVAEGHRLHRVYAQGFMDLVAALTDLSWSTRGSVLLKDLKIEAERVQMYIDKTGK